MCELNFRGAALSLGPLSAPLGIYRAVEANKAELGVEDYAVSHGSLEQVFIRFAKRQSEETGHIAGMSGSGGWDGGQEVSDRKWGAGGKSMSQQEEGL